MTIIYCDLQNSCEFNSLLSINILFWGEILSFGKNKSTKYTMWDIPCFKTPFFKLKKSPCFHTLLNQVTRT